MSRDHHYSQVFRNWLVVGAIGENCFGFGRFVAEMVVVGAEVVVVGAEMVVVGA